METRFRLRLILAIGLLPVFASPVLAQMKVDCRGPSGGHTGAQRVCDALRPVVGNKSGEIILELTQDEPTALAGRLNWSVSGASGRGPVVDVTSSDRPLDPRAAERLVRGLMAVTDLP